MLKKYKIRYDKTSQDTAMSIPIQLDFTPTDNSEMVEDKFLNDEVDKAINPIIDFKKVRFKPAKVVSGVWEVVDEFKLQTVFMVQDVFGNINYTSTSNVPSTYEDIGFIDDDLFCRTNRITRSFLTLSFHNTPNQQNNITLSFSNIFTQIDDDQKEDTGLPLEASLAPVSFRIGDPISKSDLEHEGYHLYWYKDLVDNAPNKEYEMYMYVEYNNANFGWTIPMYTLPTADISNIQIYDVYSEDSGLYLKVILKYDDTDDTYKYTFEPLPNQTGVEWNTATIPTITFYQVTPNE